MNIELKSRVMDSSSLIDVPDIFKTIDIQSEVVLSQQNLQVCYGEELI